MATVASPLKNNGTRRRRPVTGFPAAVRQWAGSSWAGPMLGLSLRATGLICRLGLVFLLASFVTPAEVGLFGLFGGSISYLLMAIGFDFYTFANRRLLDADRGQWCNLIRDQGVFYLLSYAVVLPASLLIFAAGYLPWSLSGWFLLLLASEHLSQELYRLLIAISEPLWANTVMFVRSGSWVLAVALVLFVFPESRRLDSVLAAWCLGSVASCSVGLQRLWKLRARRESHRPVDWRWIRQGCTAALPFLFASLSLRGMTTLDRYAVEYLAGIEVVGAYVLYASISAAVIAFLDAAVLSFALPRLLTTVNSESSLRFDAEIRRLKVTTCWLTMGFSMSAWLAGAITSKLLTNPIYEENLYLLSILMLGSVFFAFSMVPHMGLYALKRDRAIVRSHFAAIAAFAFALFLGMHPLGVASVPVALVIAFVSLLVIKTFAYRRARESAWCNES